ncbi:hypothetical protein DEU56DRAFT_908427 [Suillus clintonianus]|uniref:uncharacterized protein n=1 Tax=Suillus clintonianus TaxID=1904413 RepID=UPI001B867A0B|nr:uncharacterized protein DEU56DRAFT_908427 [Suillus clintonianus]KAG2150788.1 hypothetical protein DEU56DRAFT_908427 [Suillus clintonianus]
MKPISFAQKDNILVLSTSGLSIRNNVEVWALSTTEVEVKWKDLDKADRDDVLTVLDARKVYEKGKGWLDALNFLWTDYVELPGTLHEDTFEAKTAKFFNMVAAEYRNYDYASKQEVLPQWEWVF